MVVEGQCEGIWRDATDGAVWAELVVFMTPVVDEEAGFVDGVEPMLIEAVITKGAVKGFNESILHGLTGLDVMKMNMSSLCPKVDSLAGELRSVVGGDGLWQTTSEGKLFQDINDGSATDGGIDMESQALTGKVVHQGEAPKAATGGKLVMNEVHGPALIGAMRLRQRHTGNGWQLLAVFTAQGKPFLSVDAFGSLVVDDQPLRFEHIVEDR